MPFSTRLRSDDGARATLEKFFELCDAAGPACAFGPGLRDPVCRPRGSVCAPRRCLVTDPETGEEFLRHLCRPRRLHARRPVRRVLVPVPRGVPRRRSRPRHRRLPWGARWQGSASVNALINKRGFPHYPNFVEAFPAVACEDGNNPDDHAVWSQQGARGRRRPSAISVGSGPGPPARVPPGASRTLDRYVGPFDRHTANPVLVIGNLYDPATRYQGAQLVAGLLPDSALLTVDVPGHTSLGASPCAGELTGAYLLDPARRQRSTGSCVLPRSTSSKGPRRRPPGRANSGTSSCRSPRGAADRDRGTLDP